MDVPVFFQLVPNGCLTVTVRIGVLWYMSFHCVIPNPLSIYLFSVTLYHTYLDGPLPMAAAGLVDRQI